MSLSADHSCTGSRKAFAPVKHQEQCGSCWTFSTTTECLVDCYCKSIDFERTTARELFTVDSTCNGDLMNNGIAFAAKNAICTEASYSYACLATESTCMEVSRGTETYPQTESRL